MKKASKNMTQSRQIPKQRPRSLSLWPKTPKNTRSPSSITFRNILSPPSKSTCPSTKIASQICHSVMLPSNYGTASWKLSHSTKACYIYCLEFKPKTRQNPVFNVYQTNSKSSKRSMINTEMSLSFGDKSWYEIILWRNLNISARPSWDPIAT